MSRFVAFDRVVAAFFCLCLLLGGASAQGHGANVLLQVLAALLIGYCVSRPVLGGEALPRTLRWFWLATAVLAVLPLIPLPPPIWANLPGRAPLAADYALVGLDVPWRPLSFSPWDSLASLTWWLPATALFIAMRRSDGPSAELVARCTIGIAVASIALSAVQRSGGGLYPYSITNYGVGVGFFANANHQATFLLSALCLLAGLYVHRRRSNVRAATLRLDRIVFAALAVLLATGVVLSNSLAGLGLLLPALIGGLILVRDRQEKASKIGALLAVGVTLALLVAYATGLLESELSANEGSGLNRLMFNTISLRAALDFAPFGTGLGTFELIYRLYEDPAAVGTTFVNHAHNDLAELLVETGVLGLACLALFLTWWARRTIAVWTARARLPFPAAASLLTVIVMAHSLVDYPLRTAAMSCVFFVAVALMLRSAQDRDGRHRRTHRATSHVMAQI
jgi:putative inorganic carbon (hco3(-)) transporter